MLTLLPLYEAFARQRTFYRLFFKSALCLFFFIMFSHFSFAQSGPPLEWSKKYGGNGRDSLTCWLETADGYLIGGSSRSGIGSQKTSPNKGGYDYWVIKLNKEGNKVWDKTFGGSSNDLLKVILKTAQNNFLLIGSSLSGIDGDKTSPNKGEIDFWVVEISSNGTMNWDKTYGGAKKDDLVTAISTTDGGVLLGGNSNSSISGDKSEEVRPFIESEYSYTAGYDYWIVKINSSGTKIFDKTFGGVASNNYYGSDDVLTSIIQTEDNGFLIGGFTSSNAGFEKSENSTCNGAYENYDFCEEIPSTDFWVIRVDAYGIKQWDKVYGKNGYENLNEIVKGHNGEYLLLGQAYLMLPYNDPFVNIIPGYAWIVTIDEQGTIINTNQSELGHPSISNNFTFLDITADNSGYYLLSQENNNSDFILEKFDWNGNLLWTNTVFYGIENENPSEAQNDFNISSGFLEISQSGELFVGGSGYGTETNDYLIYKFQSAPKLFSKFFYGGVDLNSANASTKVGDVYYQGDKFFPNFSYTGRLFENQSIPLEPAPDAEKAKMLRSVVASRSKVPAVFNFSKIPPGTYEVYLYTWEDNYSTTFSIDIQDQRVLFDYKSGSKGSWAKLGPFKTTVTDRKIKIVASGGDANISGIELWRVEEGVLERAINLNSSSDAMVGQEVFQASRNAPDFSFTGRTFENQSIALVPKTVDSEAKMIRSSIYATRFSPATLTIGTQTSGAYAVYLYIWEDNYSQYFKLDIDGQVVYNGNSGKKGQWKLLGPFNVISGDNKIVIKACGGPMLSGVKLYRLNSSAPSGLRTAAEEIATESVTSFNVYPIPMGSKLNVVLPEIYKGKGSIAIMDHMGQTYLQQEKEYNGDKEFSIDLPTLKSGVYYLKVQYGSKAEIKRLIKE